MQFLQALRFVASHFGLRQAISLVVIPRVFSRISNNIRFDYNYRLRKFFRSEIGDIIEKYKTEPILQSDSRLSNDVYTLWWQTDSAEPEVVKLCRQSVIRNLNGHSLVVLNKDNYQNLISLPDFLYKRLHNGEISLSHLSDIIRVSLLSQYGGTWIDSCLFCLYPMEHYHSLTMPRFPDNNSPNLGKWWFGHIYAPSGHKLMRFMKEVLLRYWELHDTVIEYLMFDSFMMIAYEEFDDVRAEIDGFKISSPDLHRARYMFSNASDPEIFNAIISNNRFLSLTWRINYPQTQHGLTSYYAALKSKFNMQDL